MSQFYRITLCGLALLISACSASDAQLRQYQSSRPGSPIKVPEDLDRPRPSEPLPLPFAPDAVLSLKPAEPQKQMQPPPLIEEDKETHRSEVPQHLGVYKTDAQGVPYLQMQLGFAESWRQLSLALGGAGFTVLDRDRSQGLFYIRYKSGKKKSGGWFSNDEPTRSNRDEYQVQLIETGGLSRILIRDSEGKAALKDASAETILNLIQQHL